MVLFFVSTNMKVKSVLLCIFPIFGVMMVSCSSGNSSTADPNTQLQTKLQEMSQSFLNTYSASTHVSALPILAQCGGQAPVYVYNGTMSYGGEKKITESSVFQIGSITKSFTSVVLLQLAAESTYNYNLDQPIGQWLTNIPTSWQSITTRQLMHMVSGIPSYTTDQSFMQTYVYDMPYAYHDLEFFALSQANKSVLFAPGENYDYSNTNYTLMGMLIESITSRSVYQEVENRIILPLGLEHTYFPDYLPELVANPEDLVSGYFTRESVIDNVRFWTLSPMNSAGGVISNINDVNTYVYNLYNPGKLLNQEQLQQLESLVSLKTGQAVGFLSESNPLGFGLGVFAAYIESQQFYTYTGETLGFKSTYYYNPQNKNMVVYTANAGGGVSESYNAAYSLLGIDIMLYLESHC